MSLPVFPSNNPEITFDNAINMILASIAMEELALSHIMNAEGEQIQYVLGTLKEKNRIEPDIRELLEVNRSVACLLESAAKNQALLKDKMEKAINASSEHQKHTRQNCKCRSCRFKNECFDY